MWHANIILKVDKDIHVLIIFIWITKITPLKFLFYSRNALSYISNQMNSNAIKKRVAYSERSISRIKKILAYIEHLIENTVIFYQC